MREFMTTHKTFFLVLAGIIAVFFVRTLLALNDEMPRLFDLFNTLTIAGALFVLLRGYRSLLRSDWITALSLGVVVGIGMAFATLFSPYPFFGVVRDPLGQAVVRGLFVSLAGLGGLTIMRQGGPVPFHIPDGGWRKSGKGLGLGLAIGLPLAVVNIFALQFSTGKAVSWQNPFAALLDALQPGIVEEVIYRFALWGLLWLILRRSLPARAVWLAGLLALLVHNYAHFDDLFIQAPLVALGMGLVLALFWGLPPLILARRHGLESAIAFHWIQDAARFLAGF